MAVVAALSKGYDLDYIWKQVDRGPAKDAASYYIQASESGGEPPGRWWGPGAKALGFEPGQRIDREPYDLLFGQRKAPDGTPLGKPPGNGRRLPTALPDRSTCTSSKPDGQNGAPLAQRLLRCGNALLRRKWQRPTGHGGAGHQ